VKAIREGGRCLILGCWALPSLRQLLNPWLASSGLLVFAARALRSLHVHPLSLPQRVRAPWYSLFLLPFRLLHFHGAERISTAEYR